MKLVRMRWLGSMWWGDAARVCGGKWCVVWDGRDAGVRWVEVNGGGDVVCEVCVEGRVWIDVEG